MNITNLSIANLGHRAPSWQCRRGDASPPGEDTLPPGEDASPLDYVALLAVILKRKSTLHYAQRPIDAGGVGGVWDWTSKGPSARTRSLRDRRVEAWGDSPFLSSAPT